MPNKALSAKHVLAFSFGFWATAIIVRLVIFWAFLQDRAPAIYIHNHHVHHFIFGLLLLLLSGALYYYSTLHSKIILLLAGIGSGLMFDEFLYWTRGIFNYWSIYNFLALALAATICLMLYIYAKRQALCQNLSLPGENFRASWLIIILFIYISFLYSLFSMQHTLVAQAKEQRSVKKQMRVLGTKAKSELFEYKFIQKLLN